MRHLKGYNATHNRKAITLNLLPVKKVENIHLDPATYLLPLLMARGQLREVGTGRIISSVAQLTSLTAAELQGCNGPLFQAQD